MYQTWGQICHLSNLRSLLSWISNEASSVMHQTWGQLCHVSNLRLLLSCTRLEVASVMNQTWGCFCHASDMRSTLSCIRLEVLSAGVEIIKQSLSVSSLISIFGLRSVQKIVLNQYKLSILALFTFKFPKFQRVYSTELKIKSASKLRKGKWNLL